MIPEERFDPVGHLLLAARGMRPVLGGYAPKRVMGCAADLINGIAESVAGLTSDNRLGDPGDILRAAVARRVRDVRLDDRHAEAVLDESDCPPGCLHLAHALLLSATELRRLAARRVHDRLVRAETVPAPGLAGILGERLPRPAPPPAGADYPDDPGFPDDAG